MPKVSVIIPVFNVKPYLEQCLNSLLSQTLTDLEYIIVDDGSFDGSSVVCDRFAKTDGRIQVIHKKNEGLSCARNDGIKVSTAPYIMFVDGDDWVEPEFCRLPYNMAVDNGADLVLFSFKKVRNNGRVVRVKTRKQSGFISEAEAIDLNMRGLNAAWLGLYHKDLFNNVKFPAGKVYEDICTSHRFIHEANRICFINQALYNHRVGRIGSIKSDLKNDKEKREMVIKKIDNLRNWGYYEYSQIYAFRLLLKYGWKDRSQKPFVDMANEKGYARYLFSIKQKLMLAVYRISPSFFDIICVSMGRRVK